MDVLTLCIMLLYSSIYAELMVECEPKDIRYVATEFDGWNERHWTVPFEGDKLRIYAGVTVALCAACAACNVF